jgi:hypothetical protein
MIARPFIGGSSEASTIARRGGSGHGSQARPVFRSRSGVDLSPRPSRQGRAWRWRALSLRLASPDFAGREGAVRLGRPEVLLVQFGLAWTGLVPVRLCVAARIWLGRGRRMAWLAPPGLRPPPAPPRPSPAPSSAAASPPPGPREAARPSPARPPPAPGAPSRRRPTQSLTAARPKARRIAPADGLCSIGAPRSAVHAACVAQLLDREGAAAQQEDFS